MISYSLSHSQPKPSDTLLVKEPSYNTILLTCHLKNLQWLHIASRVKFKFKLTHNQTQVIFLALYLQSLFHGSLVPVIYQMVWIPQRNLGFPKFALPSTWSTISPSPGVQILTMFKAKLIKPSQPTDVHPSSDIKDHTD